MKEFRKTLFNTSIYSFFLLSAISSFGQNSLQVQIGQIATNIKGNIGVCAMILETGETVSYNGDKRFPMQSVYKVPIAMAVLDKVDKGTFTLEQNIRIEKSEYIPKNGHSPIRDKFPNGAHITIKELIRYNISESDGTACDVLLRILGGTRIADQYIHQLGVKDIAIATTEMVQVSNDTIQYQNWATPNSMTELLKILYADSGLSKKSGALVLKDMIESKPGPKRLKGLLPAGIIVAHKTGTSGTFDGLTRATNDAGIITLPNGKHLAITVFISDCFNSETDRELTIAKISKAAFDFWNTSR